jgi:pilus assembly protein Flp/PilA
MLTLIANAQTLRLCAACGVSRLMGNRAGATAVEYGLIVAGIAIAVIAAVFAIGESLDGFFSGIETQINSRQPG